MTELTEPTISDNTNTKLRPNFNDETKRHFSLRANSSVIFFFFRSGAGGGGGGGGDFFSIPTKIVAFKGDSYLSYWPTINTIFHGLFQVLH